MGGRLLPIVLVFQIFSNYWICVHFFLPKWVSLLHAPFVLGLCPFAPSNKIDLFIYKKKIIIFSQCSLKLMSEKEVLKIWRLASFCV